MLTAKELWKNYHRMCDAHDSCKDCPAWLGYDNAIHKGMLCDDMERVDEFIQVVEKWSEDNPIITNRQKFKEVFGFHNSIKPSRCSEYTGKTCNCLETYRMPCNHCPWWDEPYKEVIK